MAQIETNLQETVNRFIALQMTSREKEKIINNLISKALSQARKRLSEAAKGQMESDKRQAWRAVKYSIYKQIMGGNISIFSRRRAGARASVPASKRGRMPDTERYESYLGADRSFILRILNAANSRRERIATHMNGHEIRRRNINERRGKNPSQNAIGYRGRWNSAGGFFEREAGNAMAAAASELSMLLCEEIERELQNLGK